MTKPLPKPFILLNIPKTGTVYIIRFVRNADLLSIARKFKMDGVLLRHPLLYRTTLKWWWRLHRRGVHLNAGRIHSRERHTFHCRLPAPLRQLPAITRLREPLSWHVSQYVYMTGKLPLRLEGILHRMMRDANTQSIASKNRLHSFVKKYLDNENSADSWSRISLEGCWRFSHHFRRHWMLRKYLGVAASDHLPLGVLACRTMLYIHRNPKRLFTMPAEDMEEYFADKRWLRDLADIRFLRFEKLQEDLRCVMLEQLGYNREILDAVLQLMPARVNVSDPARKERALRELEQKPELREEILRSERIYAEHILPLAGNFRND